MLPQANVCECIDFDNPALASQLFGPHDANLELLGKASGAHIISRGASICIEAEDSGLAQNICRLFLQIYGLLRDGISITRQDFLRAYELIKEEPTLELAHIFRDAVFIKTPQKNVCARNLAQKNYLELLKKKEIVFSVGPAGTGKTYLAVAMGLSLLQQHQVKRIVLTRPAVEAGERLGFLPGDLAEKVNPYLRPLHDALHDMLPQAKVAAMQETGTIEIAPLAFMRGRTLNDAFVILDEAQNTTVEQMKMFLTRMGMGTRMVVTGDTTQIDLPRQYGGIRPESGLVHALEILHGISGIAFHFFNKDDVVRHPLVGAIVNAYDNTEKEVPST